MITPPSVLLKKIAGRLSGLYYPALTVAERQIADLLIPEGLLVKGDDNNLRDRDAAEPSK